MPKNKKSLLQTLKDAVNSFQDIAETEEEQEAVDNIQEDVEKLEEKSEEQVNELEKDAETDTETDDNSDEQTEEVSAETYTAEEVKPMLEGLALSDASVKEASEFIATLSKEAADKLIPLLKKVLDETTASSIQTLLSETKSKKVTTGSKKVTPSLGQRMAAEANKRKGA
uniref:hypothetical protein n=1 Tax=Lactococcus garvieae TaxID=1363 RepID=UPI00359C4467